MKGEKTVLVFGSGGREHALAWKLSQSHEITRLIVSPGNPGMPEKWERWPYSSAQDFAQLAARARREGVSLVVVGPDHALADGLVDVLQAASIPVFGPTKAAARIEWSKAFAKDVMKSAGIPTARHWVVSSLEEATKLLRSVPWGPGQGWVLKADGLALGKGVRVCGTLEESLEAARALLKISPELVIEERLDGEELSWMAICDGTRCALLEPARDYKRVGEGDEGANTGGMGSFSPVPGVPQGFEERVREQVFLPALREMAARGTPFKGLLYAGLMADFAPKNGREDRFWVIEFNSRFGDPETQVLMPRIEGDILPWFEASARGDLSQLEGDVPFTPEAAVYVVGAARGYPESPEKGQPIQGVAPGADGYFFAGVSAGASGLVTSGGRVFGALGLAWDLERAREQAFERLGRVGFEGMHFRRDIGVIR